MQKKSNYITYAQDLTYEPQSMYLECGQGGKVCVELKELGTKRILVMGREPFLKGRDAAQFVKKLEQAGFRVFKYILRQPYSSSSDITGALNEYLGYNCDTIVVIGGGDEIFCAKMVSAMAINGMKNPVEAEGYGKIKSDISVLCCIGMDNSTAISSNVAEFRDENTGRWISVFSDYLVPQIVVVDTDIAMRSYTNDSVASALDSLAMGIECCLSPVGINNPAYKACARSAIRLVTDNVLAMKDDPDDGFIRKKIAVAGIYAGIAVRKTGFGYTHLAVHALKSRFGPELGKCYCRILSAFLRENFELTKNELADIYDSLICDEVRPGYKVANGIPEKFYNVENSANAMIDLLGKLYSAAVSDDMPLPKLTKKDIHEISEEIRISAEQFGLVRVDEGTLTRILEKI